MVFSATPRYFLIFGCRVFRDKPQRRGAKIEQAVHQVEPEFLIPLMMDAMLITSLTDFSISLPASSSSARG